MIPFREAAPRLLPWVASATALVAATRFFGDLIWPCPVSCQGGGHYQALFGVPVHVPAVVALLGLAVLAWRRRSEAAWAAWAAAGGSLYFLWIAWRIDLRCAYCFTVHAGVLLCALLATTQPVRWGDRLGLAALAFLALHLAFHPGVVEDGPVAAPPVETAPDVGGFFASPGQAAPPPAADPALLAQVEALRRRGDPAAPCVLEIAVDLHCPHCSQTYGPLLDALRAPLSAGRVEAVSRFLVRRSAPSGGELAAHVLAAEDAAQARLLVNVLLGTHEGRGWAWARPLVGEVADAAVLERNLAARRAAIDAVLAGDGRRLRALNIRATPFAILTRRDGTVLARFAADAFDPAAIARAIPAP